MLCTSLLRVLKRPAYFPLDTTRNLKPVYSLVLQDVPPMSCRSQLQELRAAKTLISCQHFGVIYSPLMASGARGQWAGERWKLSLPPSTLFHLHLCCQSVSITLGGMRSSERSADPLPAPLPEPEGSLIAALMSPLLEIYSCAPTKFIHSIPLSTKINICLTFLIFEFRIWNVYFLCEKQWTIDAILFAIAAYNNKKWGLGVYLC